ncbi:acyl-ACP--UDP-N-acetylglucosamine O-acyltransferase [Parendozoicomonas haliclonae]|uniref:Acyl-[acyl-carrier-protein]--UDP-N-acetylglucosamine O-acyltransferase n=1 Tax=Parendozoicomonas haliclonae TaxID=1960125 RepID=A0A1X7AHC6_9GAMM|nr:Acyl-[acyl-carrier-protein]-UDP-N-acetylglucosamine O-acyltransferase [Parendozoicomonas haliclonae]
MIDSRAVIHPSARLADDVEVGPFTTIGPDVEIGAGTKIHSHVVIKGPTTIGRNNTIFQFSSVGEECQDKKYRGEPTRLEIGDNNIIREGCTLHRGTVQDNSLTRIGSNNLLMAYVHVAHDCLVGDNCILANNTALAGHVVVDNDVILGGFTTVHQFCRIGRGSMTAAGTGLFKDLPAYIMASGSPAEAHGMNFEGMRRRGWSDDTIRALRRAYKVIYRQNLKLTEAVEVLQGMAEQAPQIEVLVSSLLGSTRGIVR